MPVLLAAPIAAGLGALGVGAGTPLIITGSLAGVSVGAAAVAEVVSGVVALGATVGASLLLNRSKKSLQPTTNTINQALPNRFVDCGRVKTGGATVYYAAPSVALCVGKVLTCAKINAIESIMVGDYANAPAGEGVAFPVAGPWAPRVQVEYRLGSPDQPALDLLFGTGEWTADHRLRGLACIAELCVQADEKQQAKAYPNGAPNVTAIIEGAMVPDPRNPAHDLADPETWTYSDNFACVLLRWGLDIDGWGLDPDAINIGIWQQACTDSDAAAATPDGTEPCYRAWGRYTTAAERKSTLDDLLQTAGATLIEQPDGTVGLFVGRHREPAITITAEHILEKQYERWPDALERVDGVSARITWEDADWQEQEVPTVWWPGATGSDVDDLPLAWCPSPWQAQRLAKARLRRLRPDWTLTLKTDLVGLQCYGEPVVRLVIPELGIDGTFEITQQPTLDPTDMTVSLQVRSYASDTWTMDPSEMNAMGAVTEGGGSYGVPEPEGLASSVSGTTTITVTWDTVAEESAYTSQAQWRVYFSSAGAEDGWADAASVAAGTATITVPGPDSYDVRVRRVTARGTESDWAILPEIEVAP